MHLPKRIGAKLRERKRECRKGAAAALKRARDLLLLLGIYLADEIGLSHFISVSNAFLTLKFSLSAET